MSDKVKEMIEKFEKFLQDIHGEQYVGTDDLMPEDYEEWLQDLDTDTWLEYGAKFALKQKGEK